MLKNGLFHSFYSVINDYFVDHLILAPEDDLNSGPRHSRIDCGPKLANLRRYWRDYYVEPNSGRVAISISSASSTASEEPTNPTIDHSKVRTNWIKGL